MKLYDVVAVDLGSCRVRLIAENKTKDNADAIMGMAVINRGVDIEFFAVVEHGTYAKGDKWRTVDALP